jgi:hypothetical protein
LAQGLPTEAVQAEEAKVRAEAYAIAIQSRLQAKDWEGAEAAFTTYGAKLGPRATQLKAAIATLKQDIQGEAAAMKLVEDARDPATGRIDAAKAYAGVDTVPGPLRDEARQRLEHRVGVEEKKWKQQVDTHYDRAFTAYLTGGLGSVDSTDKAWLIQNAPEEWDKLRRKAIADADRLRWLRDRDARGPAERETQAEREALVELRADIAANPERYREMTTEEFTSAWGHRLSDPGYKEGGGLFASTKKEPKGTAAEFTRFIADEVRGNPELRNKKFADQFKADMGDRRRAFLSQHKREPTLDELEEMKAGAYAKTIRKGLLFDSEVPAYRLRKTDEPPAEKKAPPPLKTPPPGPDDLVTVTDGKQSRPVPASKVDAFLKKYPGWRKK